MNIKECVSQQDQALNELESIVDKQLLDDWNRRVLGKNGWVSQLNRCLKDTPSDQRGEFGKQIQETKRILEKAYAEKESAINVKNVRNWDMSASGYVQSGAVHPLAHTTNLALDLFLRKGFRLLDGDDVEIAYYNFDALNTSPMHPSRSDADTFYFKNKQGSDELLLRTHTTSVQARALEKAARAQDGLSLGLPLYGVMTGNVYRRDDDVTHSPMFSQLEGIVVDENLTIQHLKGWILDFIHELLPDVEEIRFRPSFFPFTYLSAEIDIKFKGKSNWLEIMGCGMIHPEILKRANIDTNKYRGLAFGLGLERLTMLKYGLTDLRDLYANDTQFLDTFRELRYT